MVVALAVFAVAGTGMLAFRLSPLAHHPAPDSPSVVQTGLESGLPRAAPRAGRGELRPLAGATGAAVSGTTGAADPRSATPRAASRSVSRAPTAGTGTGGPSSPAAADSGPATATGSGSATSGTCVASYYGVGTTTANGEPFDPTALTAASPTLPFDTRVRVTNPATGGAVVVRINDRGPYVAGRCLDLTPAAFGTIADLGAGILTVAWQVLP